MQQAYYGGIKEFIVVQLDRTPYVAQRSVSPGTSGVNMLIQSAFGPNKTRTCDIRIESFRQDKSSLSWCDFIVIF